MAMGLKTYYLLALRYSTGPCYTQSLDTIDNIMHSTCVQYTHIACMQMLVSYG